MDVMSTKADGDAGRIDDLVLPAAAEFGTLEKYLRSRLWNSRVTEVPAKILRN